MDLLEQVIAGKVWQAIVAYKATTCAIIAGNAQRCFTTAAGHRHGAWSASHRIQVASEEAGPAAMLCAYHVAGRRRLPAASGVGGSWRLPSHFILRIGPTYEGDPAIKFVARSSSLLSQARCFDGLCNQTAFLHSVLPPQHASI